MNISDCVGVEKSFLECSYHLEIVDFRTRNCCGINPAVVKCTEGGKKFLVLSRP